MPGAMGLTLSSGTALLGDSGNKSLAIKLPGSGIFCAAVSTDDDTTDLAFAKDCIKDGVCGILSWTVEISSRTEEKTSVAFSFAA